MKTIRTFLLSLIIVFVFIPRDLFSQEYVGDVNFYSQEEVDNFSFTSVTGNVYIFSDLITNLNGLSSLTSISGNFCIDYSFGLQNLDGLNSLTSVGGDLRIEIVADLENLDGLSSLQTVGGNLKIQHAWSLQNIDGLSSLTSVGGNLTIELARYLENLDGLSALNSIGGSLFLHVCQNLGNLDGLMSLQSISREILISRCNITNLNGLSSLEYVGFAVFISDNPNLSNIDGLSSLMHAGSYFQITNNPQLFEYCGIYNLIKREENPISLFCRGNGANPDHRDINNTPRILSVTGPVDPVQVGGQIQLDITYKALNAIGITIDWGDAVIESFSPGNRSISPAHIYLTPGVYPIKIVLNDICSCSDEYYYEYVVIYDPGEGFVTGSGWIESPFGAYKADPGLSGKAFFGFVSRYKKGLSIPEGKTEFRFKAADVIFKSTEYEWLTMNVAAARAKFKGSGEINGQGDYGFMISVIDAELTPSSEVDKFRIKIWDRGTDEIVYDNNIEGSITDDPVTGIGGGDIVIHKGKKSKEIMDDSFGLQLVEDVKVYPNPFSERLFFEIYSPVDIQARIDIIDISGRITKTVFNGHLRAEQLSRIDFEPGIERDGLYFYRINIGDKTYHGKVSLVR